MTILAEGCIFAIWIILQRSCVAVREISVCERAVQGGGSVLESCPVYAQVSGISDLSK